MSRLRAPPGSGQPPTFRESLAESARGPRSASGALPRRNAADLVVRAYRIAILGKKRQPASERASCTYHLAGRGPGHRPCRPPFRCYAHFVVRRADARSGLESTVLGGPPIRLQVSVHTGKPVPGRHRLLRELPLAALLTVGACWMPHAVSASDEETVVNIYSARKEALILPLLERFRDEAGVSFNLVTGTADELLKRLQLEGSATPADVLVTTDAGRLHRAKEADVLQPIGAEAVYAAVPEHLRDADGYWTGLSLRARTIIYAADRVDAAELSTYRGLIEPEWKGRVCVRSSSNIYNQSLVASMIETEGPEQTETRARGLVENFARPPAATPIRSGRSPRASATSRLPTPTTSADSSRAARKRTGMWSPDSRCSGPTRSRVTAAYTST